MKLRSKTDMQVFLLSVAVTVVLAVLLSVTGLLQKPLAIHIASVYLLTHHLDQGIMLYQSICYEPYSDSFVVSFRSPKGDEVRIMVGTSPFPVLVQYDSLSPGQA